MSEVAARRASAHASLIYVEHELLVCADIDNKVLRLLRKL
jgi:hypothetical protein